MPATIGPYTLHTIETGRFRLDGGAMFGIIPKPLWERKIPADERNRIPLHMRCLLLEGAGRVILIDAGLGDTYDRKFADIFAVDHDYAELRRSLREVGVRPEEVTDVVLTHLHFDHCGGCTTRREGRLQLTFPNARHHVQRTHWDWARSPNRREQGSFLDENLEPLAASEQLHLADGNGELFPGVEVLVVNGHTEGQQLVKVAGSEGTLLFAADLFPTTAHLRDVWIMAYDVRPLVSLEEKETVLERALREGWSLFFEHDPEVAVADLHRRNGRITTTAARSLDAL